MAVGGKHDLARGSTYSTALPTIGAAVDGFRSGAEITIARVDKPISIPVATSMAVSSGWMVVSNAPKMAAPNAELLCRLVFGRPGGRNGPSI